MKTLISKEKSLCAIIENQAVYLVNVNFTKIYKQFGLSTFNSDGWSKVDNPTEKRFKGLKNRFKHEQIHKKLIDKKQAERTERSKKTTVKSWIDQSLQNKLKNKLENLAAGLPDMGYSMGAKMVVSTNIGGLSGYYDNRSNYSKSCKYRPTHGYFQLKISFDELKNAENIGGLFTYVYPNQKNKVKKCWWFERIGEKQYYELKKVYGYVFEGYHHIDKQACKKGGLANIERKKQDAKRKKQAEKEKQVFAKNYKKALRLQYGYNDSLNAGNCETGTKAFILRCNLDSKKQYRGSFLLKVAHEKSTHSVSYVERMIRHKAKNI